MKKLLIFIITAVFLLSGCNGDRNVKLPRSTDKMGQDVFSAMTIEEKVGQILFVRCVENELIDELMEKQPGGVLMFGRDFEGLTKKEVKTKINTYQKKSRIPLVIGVDEEGGTVVRVSSNPKLVPEKYESPQKM